MDTESQKIFIVRFAYWLIVAGIIYVFLKYLMPAITPFLIGSLVAVSLRPLAKWVAGVTKVKQKWMAVIILVLFYSIVGTLLTISGIRLASAISHFFSVIPDYYRSTIEPAVRQSLNTLIILFQEIDPTLQATIQSLSGNVISSMANLVTTVSTAVLNWVTGFAGAFPGFMINFLITVLASFYVSADYPGIKSFILKQLSQEKLQLLRQIKNNTFKFFGSYIKACCIMTLIMFVELLIGFFLIGVRNAPGLALVIALFDALPVVGTGTILIPWIIVSIISGELSRALKLAILYGVVLVVRNTIEPKVVGMQIGLYPLITLLCMYLGASLFGIVGLIVFPLAGTILTDLNKSGTIHLYKEDVLRP
ncbi:MAG: sporulation integral membrane protein YtvI [Clostridiales bacterium]|nr:sporulation integral membrane protein YtvI [Clostridiales bacterium]